MSPKVSRNRGGERAKCNYSFACHHFARHSHPWISRFMRGFSPTGTLDGFGRRSHDRSSSHTGAKFGEAASIARAASAMLPVRQEPLTPNAEARVRLI